MVAIHFPQVIFLALGLSAAIIFMLARLFHISNTAMALLSSGVFLALLVVILFQDKLIQSGRLVLFDAALSPTITFPENSYYTHDPGANLIISLCLGLAASVSLYSAEYLNLDHRQRIFYPLVMMMVCGFTGMLYASSLMVLYLFTELMSISTYALVAFRRQTDTAIEAGFKYLMMGSVASIVILFGITLLFFEHGTINIQEITLSANWISQAGALLIFAGYCLKSALMPMHTWLPDAHGRAPSSVSAILSGIMVQGAFYTGLRLMLAFGLDVQLLGTILLVVAILNILVGNLLGLVQTHTKRLLGYSTLAQVGYIALCFAIGLRNNLPEAFQAGFFIIIAHALAKSLAFLCKGIFHYYGNITKIKDLSYSIKLSRHVSIIFGLSIVSLAAIPPLAGFTGKWLALTSIIASMDHLTVVAVLVLLAGSLIALGYYFPMLAYLFPKKSSVSPTEKVHISLWMSTAIICLAAILLAISILPQSTIGITEYAADFLIRMMR